MINPLISFLWGFAEATLFFIVPDVYITFVALKSIKAGIISSIYAGIGAILGGIIMYKWGKKDSDTAFNVIAKLPAVSWKMIKQVENQVKETKYGALFIGAFTGRPYKIYATVAGKFNLPFFPFLLISFPARITRFLLLGIVIGFLSSTLSPYISYNKLVILHITGWTVFYIFFFYRMRG